MTGRDRRLAALCPAGHVENFVDVLFRVLVPGWLFAQGASLPRIGRVVGACGLVWGLAQLMTGPLSDRMGRFRPNVLGLWRCGRGVAPMPLGGGFLGWAGAGWGAVLWLWGEETHPGLNPAP